MSNISSTAIPNTATRTPAKLRPRLFLLRWGFWAGVLFYGAIGFFVINVILMVTSVVIDSFGKSWFRTLLPPEFTGQWYQDLATDHNMTQLLGNTFFVAISTTLIALAIAFPAAYMLARKSFRFKGVLYGLFLMPMLVPALVYGIPLATILIKLGLGGSLIGIVIVNLVPITPFCIFVLTPFIEQVDTSLESASRMLGASRIRTFRRIVLPLIIPGLLSAGVLALVRTFAAFELTYLVATTGSSQTMAVALYGDASGAGLRAHQLVNAMAVIYMMSTMSLVVVALIFVKPTQFVVRIKNR